MSEELIPVPATIIKRILKWSSQDLGVQKLCSTCSGFDGHMTDCPIAELQAYLENH